MRCEALKILLVDDNQHMRTMLSELLRSLGCRDIYQAANGLAAMQTLRNEMIDIVVTDLAMEPVDGIAFIRKLRTAPDSPNRFIPIIMVSGHATQRRVAEARDAGVNEFLAKPITARGVLDRIRRVIDDSRSFVKSGDYFGPDRRRRNDAAYKGPWRRLDDTPQMDALEL
ncbi:MAG: response regulator [Dehalococcoidia bacterium]|nr:response regulator [Dehalococcoidia bacterium]